MKAFVNLMVVAAIAVGASACGGNRDLAYILGASSEKAQVNSAAFSSGLYARNIAATAKGQLWLTKFKAEAGQLSEGSHTLSGEAALASPGWSCDPNIPTGYDESVTCTTTEADTFKCDGTDYTLGKGSKIEFGMDIGVSGTTLTSFAFFMRNTGVVAGGSFDDGVNIDCSIKLSVDMTKLQEGEAYASDCPGEFKCTIGDEELTCEDIASEMSDLGEDVSSNPEAGCTDT